MGGMKVKNVEQKVDCNLFTTKFRLDIDGTAKPLMNEKQHVIQEKLSSHQSRLNLQRRRNANFLNRNGLRQVREGMMTMSEKLYSWGESSDAAFIPRCVDLLGEAEHFGKL